MEKLMFSKPLNEYCSPIVVAMSREQLKKIDLALTIEYGVSGKEIEKFSHLYSKYRHLGQFVAVMHVDDCHDAYVFHYTDDDARKLLEYIEKYAPGVREEGANYNEVLHFSWDDIMHHVNTVLRRETKDSARVIDSWREGLQTLVDDCL